MSRLSFPLPRLFFFGFLRLLNAREGAAIVEEGTGNCRRRGAAIVRGAHCVMWGRVLSFLFKQWRASDRPAYGKEGAVQETNSSDNRLHQEPTSKQGASSADAGHAALESASAKKESQRRDISSINGLAIGLCVGVAFGIILDSLAIGIGLGLALGALFDALKGRVKRS